MGNKIMAYWDCQYCGMKARRGDTRNCTGCGHPRDESVTFYMLDHEYVSEEEAAKITAGPDWHCAYCGGLNTSADAFCGGCGAPATASTKNYHEIQEEKKRKEAERLAQEEAERLASMRPAAPVKPEKKKKPWWLWLILFAIIASVVICLWPKTKDAVVAEHAWQTAVNIQENTYFEETDWSVPRDATQLSSWDDVYKYEEVLDHYEDVKVAKQREITVYETVISYEDLGNGYFEEISTEVPHTEYETYYETESQPVYTSVPVYKTKYKYAIWRWVDQKPITKSGSGMEPEFATVTLADNQRESGRKVDYLLKVKEDKANSTMFIVDQNSFERIKDGDEVIVKRQGSSVTLVDKNGKNIGYAK